MDLANGLIAYATGLPGIVLISWSFHLCGAVTSFLDSCQSLFGKLEMESNEMLEWEMFEQKVKELSERFHTESCPLLLRGQSNSDCGP